MPEHRDRPLTHDPVLLEEIRRNMHGAAAAPTVAPIC